MTQALTQLPDPPRHYRRLHRRDDTYTLRLRWAYQRGIITATEWAEIENLILLYANADDTRLRMLKNCVIV